MDDSSSPPWSEASELRCRRERLNPSIANTRPHDNAMRTAPSAPPDFTLLPYSAVAVVGWLTTANLMNWSAGAPLATWSSARFSFAPFTSSFAERRVSASVWPLTVTVRMGLLESPTTKSQVDRTPSAAMACWKAGPLRRVCMMAAATLWLPPRLAKGFCLDLLARFRSPLAGRGSPGWRRPCSRRASRRRRRRRAPRSTRRAGRSDTSDGGGHGASTRDPQLPLGGGLPRDSVERSA